MATFLGRRIGPVGLGLMGLTRPEAPISQQQCFAVMDTALSCGANYWNAGEFYGTPNRNSLHLLNEYFTKYPERASEVVLSVKGGRTPGRLEFDGTEKGVRRSVEECVRVLDGKKMIDIFECARVDPNTPIEETVGVLGRMVKEGMFGAIGLSEVKAETIRRAAKVHTIAQVEVELSLWSTDILHNGVAQVCAELDIPIIAYSPLSRGGLTSGMTDTKPESLPEHLRFLPRFKNDALQNNLRITEEVGRLAGRKGCTQPQIALGWIRTLSRENGLGVIVPIPGAEREDWVVENCKEAELTTEEMKEMDSILRQNPILGTRYDAEAEVFSEG